MVIMNDLEWPMLSYLCDLVWKVQKNHAANREGSFKLNIDLSILAVAAIFNFNYI